MLRKKKKIEGVFFAIALCGTSFTQTSTPSKLTGFHSASSATERQWEEKFRAIPSPDHQREYMRLLSARPHNVGSAYDQQNAEWILARLKEWGWDAHIETFEVLFPTPKTRVVELLAPTRFTAKLEEPTLAQDPTSGQKSEQLPSYNAYSRDGDVTAPLVFVNYGLQADYDELAKHGVSVKGAIVIAKYGNSWRGIKPKIAAEHGAVGCLIYSDPADDGYAVEETFPQGPMRPREGVQRGSVMDMPQHPGDPLTPGIGATHDAKRLKLSDATTISKIPTLPISYGDAQPLLAAIKGPLAPASFRGGLPLTYHLGPGPAMVHLQVESNWDIKKIYDVIARIPGATEPDQWVVRANHHDAWVNGAQDPISGQVALLEEARALGELVKQGWRPRRTIIYAAWDGEEPMLLGSTEWAEEHAGELRQHGAIYINSDGNGRGYLEVEGSHSLEALVNGVARDIVDPEKNVPVWKRRHAADLLRKHRDREATQRENSRQEDFHLGALGSGSDYTAFLDHIGMASLNIGYAGEDNEGIYHSIYDDFYWYTHFSDTDFAYGRALSQTGGTLVMRMADADLLPFRFTQLYDTIAKYEDEVKKLAQERHEKFMNQNKDIEGGDYALVSDPRHPTVAPPKKAPVPYLNWAPLENAMAELQKSTKAYDSAADAVDEANAAILGQANARLILAEQKLTDDAGLPRRPWYKHMIYAPGWYTGYGAKTLPGVREAIEQERYDEADREIARLARTISGEAVYLDQITALLKQR